MELRRHSKIDIDGASGVGFRIRSTLAAVNNSAIPLCIFNEANGAPSRQIFFDS